MIVESGSMLLLMVGFFSEIGRLVNAFDLAS